jgi:hypothetical protein
MVIGAEVFDRVGRFDVDLPAGYSDLDLCLRLNATGRGCWVVASSTVFHRGNSAPEHAEAQRPDVKAVFAAKNANRIQLDMQRYFHESLTAFGRVHGFAEGYLLVDLMSIVDRSWHHELLREYVHVASIYDYSLGTRDVPWISLVDHLGINVLESRTAILYLVDRFIALRSNQMWFRMRCRKDDVVVDRNANVVALAEVVDDRC